MAQDGAGGVVKKSSVGICLLKRKESCWVLVAHSCNPSYSGGRDQENGSSKSAGTNSS
jgi:hypothetical protein